MSRKISKIAPDWWDYTTLDCELIDDAARLTANDLLQLSRPGFQINIYDTLEEFYCAQALEYIDAWLQSTPSNPAGICGPIGPVEQLPLVAQMVNAMNLDLKKHDAHFWGMDEWVDEHDQPVPIDFPLSFAKADMEMCFNRIKPELAMPKQNLHFPTGDLDVYRNSFDQVRCVVMQGGQGEVKHWAFNDPPRRNGEYKDFPPSADEYRKLNTRVTELHPMTVIQNARTSGGGNISNVPTRACTVGPAETWKAERVSIWHAGQHDNPFGQRLTALMISKSIVDTSVPMSLLADHPSVTFSYFRGGIGEVAVEMH
ncbi:glucosamine-6-phosphate isomerase [Planctomycetota bacterium]|nr:glucosamine-6-phosphate isomerase [Planctomycetota bacterium]